MAVLPKWKISCFRNEDFASGDPEPEIIEDNVHEELVEPKVETPSERKRDWVSSLQEVGGLIIPFVL